MKISLRMLAGVMAMLLTTSLIAQSNFSTSLHSTRNGKIFWYSADTSVSHAPAPGFESITNVPIDNENVACVKCHPGDNLDANGNPYPIPYPGPNCNDCHATLSTNAVTENQCYDCHGRQKTVALGLGYSDVHRDAATPLKCWDCHSKAELHGDDGIQYNSLLEPGAIKVDCADCHSVDGGTMPADHANYDPHNDKLHCDACHVQTVLACYNCHFESQVEAHIKRAKQPIHDFIMLANREKDGKVGLASFQTLTYQGNTWLAFGPTHSHSITGQGRTCTDCHLNMGGNVEAIEQYNATGEIKFATWNDADSTLSWIHGVVPIPEDFETSLKMDFLTYNGDPSDPVAPSKNWSYIGKNTWDGQQVFFISPLTRDQMLKLGFVTGIDDEIAEVPEGYVLKQNYPNPFNPSTSIDFILPKATNVTMKVYNILGSEVMTLVNNEKMLPGIHTIPFNGENLHSGVYIYRLMTSEFDASRKMLLMK